MHLKEILSSVHCPVQGRRTLTCQYVGVEFAGALRQFWFDVIPDIVFEVSLGFYSRRWK